MTTATNKEEQMVQLVRNALLVAGQEMGNGDQWPVVKDTIYKVMKDFEDLKTERAVDEEMKDHLYAQLKEMEAGLDECDAEMRAILTPRISELREVCDAYFSDLDPKAVKYESEDAPPHVQRMKAILDTMEDDHD